jgi:hypothetical protein
MGSRQDWADPGFRPAILSGHLPELGDAKDFADWLAQDRPALPPAVRGRVRILPCAGGTTSEYFWGDDKDAMCRYANGPDAHVIGPVRELARGAACEDGHDFLAPGRRATRPNGYGLYDMAETPGSGRPTAT